MRLAALAVLAALLAPSAMALTVGEKAPPILAESWINGDPVDPSKPDGKTIYVVEFWATWCPPCKKSIPHLNELSQQFKDNGLVIVGITDEPESTVRPFATKLNVQYRLAIDTNRASAATYMSEVSGIPHAFIVDTNGVVLWEGHPMAGLDEALQKIVDGTYSLANVQSNLQADSELEDVLATGDLKKALEKVNELIQKEPKNFDYYQLKLGLLVQDEQLDQIRPLYRAMYDACGDSAENLNTLAWMAATSPFTMADLDVAWKAAQRAVELSNREESAVLDTLARVQYALCNLDEAVSLQREALAKAKDDDEKADLQATLSYYESIRDIRDQTATGGKPAGEKP